jgi:leucyl-tRNA synthetase family protein
MNGRMHLGHTFAMSKAEFAARYHRMIGDDVLWPFAFHCTGMPIKAAADKLQAEIREFGCPPKFPDAPHFGRACTSYEQLEERQFVHKRTSEALLADFNQQLEDAGHAAKDAKDDGKAGVSKKAKVLQKTGGVKRQWDILLASGVAASEIAEFQASTYWLKYFPQHYITDLRALGTAIDMRRSFITTEKNPYYDAFVQWQYRTLQRDGKLKFGKRHSIFSPKDGQACADHDRASGEGVTPQEYTVVKLRVLEPLPAVLAPLAHRRIYLAPATLRPETMYGQTNCFVLPSGDYGAYEVSAAADGDVFVMSEQGALNFAHQGFAPAEGKIKCLATFKGSAIVGAALKAPLTSYEKIYTLPMLTIKMTKGTGVVTSVPSDSPDDFATMRDLQKKADLRAKFGLKDEMVLPFVPVPIIETSKYGQVTAAAVCDLFKINSQNDTAQLALAKEEAYKAGFYDGVFLVGEFKGAKVSDAKDKVRQRLIESGEAVPYWEPMSTVVSRSGETCVVALTDQWYVDYAQPEWKAAVRTYVERNLETYGSELKQLLLDNVDRLHEWGCSRSFGLGTHLPADPQFLIESLSDSTIYMAFYTIAHLLQGGNVDPDRVVVGPLGVRPEHCTDALFDYVFRGVGDPAKAVAGVDASALQTMRREFTFWYPMDVRTSGRDLAYNHLPFAIFHHVAIFKPEEWPRGIKCCAFLEVDGKKMSKCLALGTPVLMASGEFKPVELVKAADRVMGDDGKPRTVTQTTSGEDLMVQISTSDGEAAFVCNVAHVLTLKIDADSFPQLSAAAVGHQVRVVVAEGERVDTVGAELRALVERSVSFETRAAALVALTALGAAARASSFGCDATVQKQAVVQALRAVEGGVELTDADVAFVDVSESEAQAEPSSKKMSRTDALVRVVRLSQRAEACVRADVRARLALSETQKVLTRLESVDISVASFLDSRHVSADVRAAAQLYRADMVARADAHKRAAARDPQCERFTIQLVNPTTVDGEWTVLVADAGAAVAAGATLGDIVPTEHVKGAYAGFSVDGNGRFVVGERCFVTHNSEGNFLTLGDGVERFSADGTRIALADAGDTLDVANFDQGVANAAILHLYSIAKMCDRVLEASPDTDAAPSDTGSQWDERVFEHQQRALIADVHQYYSKMMFRDVVRRALFEYMAIRERYEINSETRGRKPRRAVLLDSLKRQVLMLAPIVPHIAEHCWKKLGGSGLASSTLMPAVSDDIDRSLVHAATFLDSQVSRVRKLIDAKLNPKAAKKGKAVAAPPAAITKITISVTRAYPAWQARVLDVIRPLFNDATREFSGGDPVAALQADAELQTLVEQAFPAPAPAATTSGEGAKKAPKGKNHALIFFGMVRTAAQETGVAALATQLQFDELALFEVAAPLLSAAFKAAVIVEAKTDGKPGDPQFAFE